jgi:antitoxin HigA-1
MPTTLPARITISGPRSVLDLKRPPTAPGEMLLEEFLRPAGLTQSAAAQRMGIPLNRLNEIIRGRRAITADSAIRLGKLFKMSPEFWMGLQTDWDLWHAQEALKRASA